jgi:stage III sporulation protein AC
VNVSVLFQIAGVGLLVMVITTVLKQAGKDEQGQLVTLAGVLLVLGLVIKLLYDVFVAARSAFGMG